MQRGPEVVRVHRANGVPATTLAATKFEPGPMNEEVVEKDAAAIVEWLENIVPGAVSRRVFALLLEESLR